MKKNELLILLGNLLLASGAFNVILVGGRVLHLVSLTSNLDNSLNTLLNFSTTIALQSVCSPLILFVLENVCIPKFECENISMFNHVRQIQ